MHAICFGPQSGLADLVAFVTGPAAPDKAGNHTVKWRVIVGTGCA